MEVRIQHDDNLLSAMGERSLIYSNPKDRGQNTKHFANHMQQFIVD